jgi:hypothetical protein
LTRPGRTLLKRMLAQAIHDLDRSLGNLKQLHDEFEPVHPPYATLLEAIAQVLFFARKMMVNFWEKAWGKAPENIDIYRR